MTLHTTFRGFDREARRAGVRNHVLVLPSVICSGIVAETIADQVPEAICLPHDHGCGQIGADKNQTRRTLVNISNNPNVSGAVIVGLGCETLNSEELAADLEVPVRHTAIQTAGGTDEAIAEGRSAVKSLVTDTHVGDRRPISLEELTLGVTVSDVSTSTVEEVFPLIGTLVRSVVDAGGRVVVGGTELLVPHVDDVSDIATDKKTASTLRDQLMRRREETPPTQIYRKAADEPLDSITAMWDHLPITTALSYGERATDDGVTLVDTGTGFEETATGLAAAGAQLVVHATADGIPTGHPLVPVLKVTGEPDTASVLARDIDVDATATDGDRLREIVMAAVDGEPTAAENHGLTSFAIARSGPSL